MTSTALTAFLFEAEDQIVDDITRRLRTSSLEHYRQMETIDLGPRMEALYVAFRESVITGDPGPINAFTADIGRRRLQQGYDLEELLYVLDMLFAATWGAAEAAFRERGAEAFDDLRRIAEVVSSGKGRLATVYAEESAKERQALQHLTAAFQEYLNVRRAGVKETGRDER